MPVSPLYRDHVELYARVSTRPQDQLRNSIPSQIAVMEPHAKRLGLTVMRATEEVYSAGTRKRPELDGLLSRVRAGVVGAVMVSRYDRWSRDQLDTAVLLDVMREHGVRLISAAEGLDTLSPDGYMLWTVYGIAAENTRKMIFSQTMDRQLARALANELPDNLPKRIYGYRKLPRTDKTVPYRYEVVEHERDVIQEMARRCADGETLWSIAVSLNARGEPAPSGRVGVPWYFSTVGRILSSPIYLGLYHAFKHTPTDRALSTFAASEWARYKREHADEPIVITKAFDQILDVETFERCAASRAENKCNARRNTKRDHLLAKRFVCTCGRGMTPTSSYQKRKYGTKRYDYYRCSSSSHESLVCRCPQYRAEDVERAVWDAIKERYQSKVRMRHEIEMLRLEQASDERVLQLANLERLRDKAKALAAQTRTLLATVEMSADTLAEWTATLAKHEGDAKKYEREMLTERARGGVRGYTVEEADAMAELFSTTGDVDAMLAAMGKTAADVMRVCDVRVTADWEHGVVHIRVNRAEAFAIEYGHPYMTVNNRVRDCRFSLAFAIPFPISRSGPSHRAA